MYCAQEFHDSDSIIESPNFFQRQFHWYRMFINVKRLLNVDTEADPSPPPPPPPQPPPTPPPPPTQQHNTHPYFLKC